MIQKSKIKDDFQLLNYSLTDPDYISDTNQRRKWRKKIIILLTLLVPGWGLRQHGEFIVITFVWKNPPPPPRYNQPFKSPVLIDLKEK